MALPPMANLGVECRDRGRVHLEHLHAAGVVPVQLSSASMSVNMVNEEELTIVRNALIGFRKFGHVAPGGLREHKFSVHIRLGARVEARAEVGGLGQGRGGQDEAEHRPQG